MMKGSKIFACYHSFLIDVKVLNGTLKYPGLSVKDSLVKSVKESPVISVEDSDELKAGQSLIDNGRI